MAMQLDDFGKTFLENYISLVEAYNVQVGAVKAVDSKENFAAHFVENDPQFSEINEQIAQLEWQIEQLEAQRNKTAEPLIDTAYQAALAGSGVDPEVLKQNLASIRAAAKYLTTMYGDEVLKDTPKTESVKSGGGGGATGGRRIRGFDIYVDGVRAEQKNTKGEMRSTFTAAAKVLEVEVVDLQRAFFAEAGLEDVKAETFPTLVEFTFPDKDETPHNIKIVKVADSDEE